MSGGLDLIRTGGRYLLMGQTGKFELSISPSRLVMREISLIPSFSGSDPDFYEALQFMKNNRDRFNWDRMLPTRYPLSRINDAMIAMQSFRDIKSLIVNHSL